MNQKLDLTKYIAEQCNLPTDEEYIKNLIVKWWFNPRKKLSGGLRLTDEGFSQISKYIKVYRVAIDQPIPYTNKVIIWLDKYIDSPWYVTNKEVYVLHEKIAVQLVLFSGNIARYTEIKASAS